MFDGITLGFAILLWLAFALQWCIIGWLIFGHSKERKELQERNATLLETLAASAGHVQQSISYPPFLTVPHPVTGDDMIAYHTGNGQYSPPMTDSERVRNLTSEVEGTM